MALQFRTVVPYTVSGVLAIIGWWWFFSRKKNRSANQPGRTIANGQEKRTETILTTPAEDSIGETSPLLQNNPEEISQSCIAVPKFLPFETASKTFGDSAGSKIGEKPVHSGDLLNSDISVLDRAISSQEPSSNLLQRSNIESAQEFDVEKKQFHQAENAVYKDVQKMTIALKYPEDDTLNSGTVPTAVDEMFDYIFSASILGECGDTLTEIKECPPMESKVNAHGDSNLLLVHELVNSAPCVKNDMSSGEQEIQTAAVAKEMTNFTGCSKIESQVNFETMEESDVQYDFGKTASTNVAHQFSIKNVVQHSDCNETGSSCNVAQSVFLDGETIQQTVCNVIPACHPVTMKENLVGYTKCSDTALVAAFDEIDVVQEQAFQPTEVGDLLSKDGIVHNQESIDPTYRDAVASSNEDTFALHQKKANELMETSVSNLVGKGHKTTVSPETPMQASIIEVVYSCNNVSRVIEENAPFMEFKEMDNANNAEHTKLATAVHLPERDEINIEQNVALPCAAPVRENPSLSAYSEVIATVVERVLPLEGATKADGRMDPLTADQGPPIVLPTEKEMSTDFTKVDCSVAPPQVLVESIITCAEPPTVVLKDSITSGMVESRTLTLTGEGTRCELRKHYFDMRAIQPPAVDAGNNLDLSLNDNPKESVVVGILLNSYVESPPLFKGETVCEPTGFSQCLGKGQQFEVTESEKVSLKMAKEIDFGKREAEAIEQLAMRIVSQVILAATREILSSAVVDLPGVSCHVTDNEEGGSFGLENGMSLPGPISAGVNVLESNMHNNISKNQMVNSFMEEQNMRDDTRHLNASGPSLLSSQQVSIKENKPKCSKQTEHNEPKVSEFPTDKESFDNTNITAEDSGCSVCTSEDGINAEDPLQNTGLSTTVSSVTLFDILTTSEIAKIHTDHSASTVDAPKSSSLQENINEPDCNSEMKRNSPALTQERHWSLETDQSGGSDVNSMDSVDSGCALGKTENNQDGKPGLESKKSDLTVWEVEVPKHLVGRLIGKQGRYVSFLKQTSGAKIYISTLPYTQEFQICHIEGTQPQVDKALNQIGKKFKELNLTNIYAPPPLTLPALPMTSWLMLPDGVTVEVIVVNVVNAGHMFVQQHTHPTFHALRSLDQQMFLCYSQPGIPVLPTPVEVGVICAAPGGDKAWWRAQVVSFCTESNEVEIRYVDYGGYERVKVDILRQIRSDFVTLPFQGSEVLLDNVVPLPDEDHFSSEADLTVHEMTRGTALLAQVTNYDGSTGLPLIQLWSMLGDEVVSINRALVERGFAQWIDCY